ncbi:MAG: hypothetical protein OSA37_09155 [Flavobacteriales bacterium]|nr:hypothetical protein [Flavobacteriales bacterium]
MNLSAKLMFGFILTAFAWTGCTTPGCTDPNAENYESSADSNDGSCEFMGEVVFWYGEAVSAEMVYIYTNSLSFYVDGQIVGSTSANQFWTGAPNCGDNASITVSKNLGGASSLAFDYEVIDDYGDTWWYGTTNFVANTCTTLELTL